MYLAFTSQSPPNHMACTSHVLSFERLCPAFRGSKFKVQGSKFGVHHKRSEYNSHFPPHLGWSGGTLVQPWYLPIPIEHPRSLLFKQASLSNSISSGSSAVKRLSALDVGNWMLQVRATSPAGIGLVSCPHRTIS